VMPGMTGLQLATALRHLRPELPVLLATGYAERAEMASAGLPLLRKPFGQDALAAAIAGCLARLCGFAVFSRVCSLFINELAEKVFTTSGDAVDGGGRDPGRWLWR